MFRTIVTAATILILGTGAAHAESGSHRVEYEAWADQSDSAASVTWFDGDNTILQDTDTALPWRIFVDNDSTYPEYGMNVQNNGTGNIYCRITVDGVVKDTQVARGRYAVVGCNTD